MSAASPLAQSKAEYIMANSVEIKNLDLAFGAVKVLKNLNLEIVEGEFLVLLGSSGCGKSTLLNCIAGLLEVTDGQIFIKGENVTWAEPSDLGQHEYQSMRRQNTDGVRDNSQDSHWHCLLQGLH